MQTVTTSAELAARAAAARPIVNKMVDDKSIEIGRCGRVRFKRLAAQDVDHNFGNFDDTPWMGEWENSEDGE